MRTITLLLTLTLSSAALADVCTVVASLNCPANGVADGLSNGDCVASDASIADLWTFEGTSGDPVTIDMSSTSFDTYLVLVSPDGVPMIDNDDAGDGSTSSRIAYTLDAGGTWTIIANSLEANQTGSYTLSLGCTTTNACNNAAPSADAPASGTSTSASTITFWWTAVEGATAYRLWITDAAGASSLAASTEGTSATVSLATGAYQWRVEATFEGCAATTSEVNTLTITSAPRSRRRGVRN